MSKVVEKLKKIKIIPVIAIENAQDIIPLGKALYDNGLSAAEITFRSDAAAEAIQLLKQAIPEMCVGAGTVLNKEQVMAAKDAGAEFLVAPGFNPNTVNLCQELGLEIIPGVNNPTAIEAALEKGVTTLKFFPAEASGGINMLKSLLAPYTQIQFMPTGGIKPSNVKDYLSIDRVFACGGTWMVDPKLINEQRWDEIGRLAKEASEIEY